MAGQQGSSAFLFLCVISLICLWPPLTKADTTTEANGAPLDDLPECEFDVHLKPDLVCEMQEPDVQAYYHHGQRFCACPSFSECINEEVDHPITLEKEVKFLCYKRPTYADKKHEDMTMGILRKVFSETLPPPVRLN